MTGAPPGTAGGADQGIAQASRLKVLLVTNMYPTEKEPWFGCFVREQVDDLAALGVDLRVIHFDGRRDALNYLRAARRIRRLVSGEHFDLIHAHYGLTGAAAALQHRVPVVTTFHGSDYTGAVWWQRYVSWVVSRCSLPVFVSKEGPQILGVPWSPVIPAGVDMELFRPIGRLDARRKLGWKEDKRYALLAGSRATATKRADLFDAAVAEAREVVPELYGVTLEGFSRKQAALVLNAVDVTLMTSDREGSPVTVRESLACMTPVVSVDVGDVPEVIARLPGCGIFPRDPQALARGILEALNSERRPELRTRAARHSRHAVANRLAALYASVAGPDRRSKAARSRRLCMIVHGPFPPDPRVARATRVAVQEGWEVDVLATRQSGQPATEFVEGAMVVRLPIAHRWGGTLLQLALEYVGFTLLASIRAAAVALRHGYRVVHINNPPDFLIAAAVVPRLLGAKVIFDIHDLSPDMFAMRFREGPATRLVGRVLLAVERTATSFADAVVTVHEPYRRELVARGVPPEKISLVMNSVDERLLPVKKETNDRDGFRIVYQGTVTPPYGVHLLVTALGAIADEVPHAHLEIYGDGDSLPEIRSLAGVLGLNDRVRFSGRFLPHAEVLTRVQSASVGVIPNLPTPLNRFALPTKLFEYVALGIPVVSADLRTIREHFNDNEVLFFPARDADSLASALLQVVREPEAARARSRAAQRRYEHYRWARSAKHYAELLESCAPRAR